MNGFAHNPVEYAEKVPCPVLVLHGEDDRRVSVSECRSVFEALPGRKRFELFAGVGHEACCRSSPDHWRREISAFLDSIAE
jgi:uncharacterized protein